MFITASFRRSWAVLGVLASFTASAHADGPQVVFKNGSSVPVAALTLQGDNLVVSGAVEGVPAGQAYPATLADHIYGERPAAVSQGTALILLGKPAEAIAILEPLLAQQRASAKIPGNFWVEAARATLVAYALDKKTPKVEAIGRELSDAAPGKRMDPFVLLGKALTLPTATTAEDRLTAFKELVNENQPASLNAYAWFFKAQILKENAKQNEALEAYLTIPCLYPTGGILLNAVAEMNAAEILATLTRREEAVALLKSAIRQSPGTELAAEAKRRLDSLK